MEIKQIDQDICCDALPESLSAAQADRQEESISVSQPIITPIHQTSLFYFDSFEGLCDGLANEFSTPVYSRGCNPSVMKVEAKLAALENAQACKLFSSGMGAISATICGVVKQGDHIIFANQVYGPTIQLAEELARFGVTYTQVVSGEVTDIEAAIRPNTTLIWFESPGTMTFQLVDIEAITTLAQAKGILTGIDNTWATPLLQKPIDLGVDLVVHSATKYLGGHSDLVAGAVIGSHVLVKQIFYRTYLLNGSVIGPMDAFLLERGLRTLPLRLQQHEQSALQIAHFLQGHPRIKQVYHPAFGEQEYLYKKQMRGATGLFSFELKDATYQDVSKFLNHLKRFKLGVSWGGFDSLAISPARPNNAEQLQTLGLSTGLVRLSIGLESSETLLADLTQALAQ
jgi:cystathionine beta-lyase/cystathionine gamma-synthase